MRHREGTAEPGGADEVSAARDALDGDGEVGASNENSEVEPLGARRATDRPMYPR